MFKSKSSHKISANCSGVKSCSLTFQVNVSRSRNSSVSISNRIGTRIASWSADVSKSFCELREREEEGEEEGRVHECYEVEV